jgi:hypothetical protein
MCTAHAQSNGILCAMGRLAGSILHAQASLTRPAEPLTQKRKGGGVSQLSTLRVVQECDRFTVGVVHDGGLQRGPQLDYGDTPHKIILLLLNHTVLCRLVGRDPCPKLEL